jgi:hypothetical protein
LSRKVKQAVRSPPARLETHPNFSTNQRFRHG